MFFRKLRKNKGDADPVFFAWGIALTLFILWFALDLINMTWSRYTVKREAQNISRLYALTWINGVWDPECTESLQSRCEYSTFGESSLAKDMEKIMTSTTNNGKFTEINMMVSTERITDIGACDSQLLCIKTTDGVTTVKGWAPNRIKTSVDYGTDLYLTMEATVPFRFIGRNLGLEPVKYVVYNKFASERFSKNDTGTIH